MPAFQVVPCILYAILPPTQRTPFSQMQKKVLIIGAGPGGLTSGMMLAHRGYDVTIIEKAATIGGRNAGARADCL